METFDRFQIDEFSGRPAHVQLGQKLFDAWFAGRLSRVVLKGYQRDKGLAICFGRGTLSRAMELLIHAGVMDDGEQVV